MTEPLQQPVNPFTANNQTQAQIQKAIEEIQMQLDQKILAVFNSPEGDALLDMWDDVFVRQSVVIVGAQPGENEMREGRNSFIRKIRQTVNRARGNK